MNTSVTTGSTLRVSFGAADTTGAAINADSTPVVTVLKQGVAMTYFPTVTSIATGLYEVAIVCTTANGFVEDVEYSAYVTVIVAGVSGRDGVASFRVDTDTEPRLDETIRVCFGTAGPTGAATNADSLPTATVLEQGVALAYAPTVTNITTGLYEVAIVCSAANGFEYSKEYDAYAAATVSAITGRDGIVSFRIGTALAVLGGNTTLSLIRDRIHAVIEALTPPAEVKTLWRRYRNEGAAIFTDWAEGAPQASLRRFQVRDDGADEGSEVSNTDTDMRHVTYLVRVAYPHSARYGADQAMDRDDFIDADYNRLNYTIGIYGRANFSGTYDCTPLGAPKEIERGTGVDFLVMRARFSFYRATS